MTDVVRLVPVRMLAEVSTHVVACKLSIDNILIADLPGVTENIIHFEILTVFDLNYICHKLILLIK